jgi:hypothetical protein
MFDTPEDNLTAFFPLVSDVVSVRADKQMIWIYTQRGVALVEDVKPWRDKPVMHFPANPMNFSHFSVEASVSIPRFVNRPHPNPTAALWHWHG